MMTHNADAVLDRAEKAVGAGRSLKGTGFYGLISQLRAAHVTPEVAARVARVDKRAFENGVKLRVPAAAGNLVMGIGALAGAGLEVGSGVATGQMVRTAMFAAAFLILLLTTHTLTHWAVGTLVGIRFNYYFLGGPPPPRPGIKSDLGTYLMTPPRRRALMHASGAVVTKLIPFVMVPAAAAAHLHPATIPVLLVVGVGQIATDAAFSTKTSDWMKVRRELKAARDFS